MGYYWWPDTEVENVNDTGHKSDSDHLTLIGHASFSILPGVDIRGIYCHQSQGDFYALDGSTEADVCRAILDVKQNVLKYMSLHLE
jgi:hypothetical protein